MTEGLSLSVGGFPARFCIARAALNTVLTHTFGLGTPGITLVLQGVDASASLTGVGMDAFISMGSPGNKCYIGSQVYDPAIHYGGMNVSWRGALPCYNTDGGIEIGVESGILCAWGVWLPQELAIAL
jgi:hypothetical protein